MSGCPVEMPSANASSSGGMKKLELEVGRMVEGLKTEWEAHGGGELVEMQGKMDAVRGDFLGLEDRLKVF